MLGFWKQLLKIRKQHPALVTGTFTMLDYENQSVYAYTRTDKGGRYLVVCSFSEKEVIWTFLVDTGLLLLGNYPVEDSETGNFLKLRPFEGRLYRLES